MAAHRPHRDRALPFPPAQMELKLAGIDFFEGSAALARGMVVAAEPPLRSVLEVAVRRGSAPLEQACVRLFSGVRGFTEGADLRRAAEVVAAQEWRDVESAAGATVLRAVATVRAGGERPDRLFAETRLELVEHGFDDKAVLFDFLGGSRLLEQGDLAAARAVVDEVGEFLRTRRDSIPGFALRGISAAWGLLRAGVAARSGDPDADPAMELQRVEDDLVHSGVGLLAAQIACGRAHMLLDAGRSRLALDMVLPAVLALDAVRFTFADADRRRRWSAGVATAMAVAFRAAAQCGEHRVLAELIELTRGHGVPLPQDATGADPFDTVLGDQLPAGSGGVTTAFAGAQVVGGEPGTGRTALGLPAALRTPWGSIALEAALSRAVRYHESVRATETVDWVVPVGTGTDPP